ncbi:MAG: nitroreductase family protein [Chloroflexi bacterium]|nr:nitroreductase family protein [Chloroflexota bacterium]
MELSDVINSRRSIRKFREEDISADAILQLLEAARRAPSGSNLQPTRFIIAQSATAKEALGRSTPYKFIVKAPVVFVCCADLTVITTREHRIGELVKEGAFEGIDVDKNHPSITNSLTMDEEAVKAYLSMNVAIAIEHIVLKAVELGLGSCWIGRFDRNQVKEYLSLDDNIFPVMLLPVGHPDQSPNARPRIALDKLVLKTI